MPANKPPRPGNWSRSWHWSTREEEESWGEHWAAAGTTGRLWADSGAGERREATGTPCHFPDNALHVRSMEKRRQTGLKFACHSYWLMALSRRGCCFTRNISKCTVGGRLYRLFLILPNSPPPPPPCGAFSGSSCSCCPSWVLAGGRRTVCASLDHTRFQPLNMMLVWIEETLPLNRFF